MLILKIVGGVVALLVGIWLGLPGRYDPSEEELDRALSNPRARSKLTKRHFTPLDWFRKETRGSERRMDQGRRFRTAAPKTRKDDQREG